MTLNVQRVAQDYGQLGRQLVHDPRSKGFPSRVVVDKPSWVTRMIRIHDPQVNPRQCHLECTGCAKAMEFNAVGNRVGGVTLDKDDAHKIYSLASQLDPWEGAWPPNDTGSSGLAAAKAAKKLGLGGEYRHLFGGADEVVQLIQMGRVVNIGVWWYGGMFHPTSTGIVMPTGKQVGGHQFLARGYHAPLDLVAIRCWWGKYRDVFLHREHLHKLLMDGGDAHIQNRRLT